MRFFGFTALWTIIIDQLSKFIVVEMMDLKSLDYISVLPGFISFRMAWNRGVNFGLFADFDMRWVLIAVAVAVSIGVIVWMARHTHPRHTQFFAGLLVGGALGNVIDRLHYGAVADFLNVTCCGIQNPYAFNVADIAIFAGAIGLVIWGDNTKSRQESAKK